MSENEGYSFPFTLQFRPYPIYMVDIGGYADDVYICISSQLVFTKVPELYMNIGVAEFKRIHRANTAAFSSAVIQGMMRQGRQVYPEFTGVHLRDFTIYLQTNKLPEDVTVNRACVTLMMGIAWKVPHLVYHAQVTLCRRITADNAVTLHAFSLKWDAKMLLLAVRNYTKHPSKKPELMRMFVRNPPTSDAEIAFVKDNSLETDICLAIKVKLRAANFEHVSVNYIDSVNRMKKALNVSDQILSLIPHP